MSLQDSAHDQRQETHDAPHHNFDWSKLRRGVPHTPPPRSALTFEQIAEGLTLLGCTYRDGKWTCPCHDSRCPSLSYSEIRERWTPTCWKGCTARDLIGLIRDAFNDEIPDVPEGTYDEVKGKGSECPPVAEILANRSRLTRASEVAKIAERDRRIAYSTLQTYQVGAKSWKDGEVLETPYGLRREEMEDTTGVIWLDPRKGDEKILSHPIAYTSDGRNLFPSPELFNGGSVYIVEGELDALTVNSLGLQAVSIPGAKGWKREYVDRFRQVDDVTICLDSDSAGRDGARRIVADLLMAGVKTYVFDIDPTADNGADIGDLINDEFYDHRPEDIEAHVQEFRVLVGGEFKADDPFEERAKHERNGPHDWRHTDLKSLLDAPPKPISWRVPQFVADGTLTMLAAESGHGKSWMAQALCVGVSLGVEVAGFQCRQGRAMYFDAEMGPQMFVDQRLRPAGVVEPLFHHIDALGLDIAREDDREWIQEQITRHEINLAVFDSLRMLSPSKRENDSDDMAPTLTAIRQLSRDTGAAIIIIHHKGDGEKYYRGSSAIKDQNDGLFGLVCETEDGDKDNPILKLDCRLPKGKPPRYAPPPAERYLQISMSDGGITQVGQPERESDDIERHACEWNKERILKCLPVNSMRDAGRKLDLPETGRAIRKAWQSLQDERKIAQTEGGSWVSTAKEEGE